MALNDAEIVPSVDACAAVNNNGSQVVQTVRVNGIIALRPQQHQNNKNKYKRNIFSGFFFFFWNSGFFFPKKKNPEEVLLSSIIKETRKSTINYKIRGAINAGWIKAFNIGQDKYSCACITQVWRNLLKKMILKTKSSLLKNNPYDSSICLYITLKNK